jgi:hypothetical protein
VYPSLPVHPRFAQIADLVWPLFEAAIVAARAAARRRHRRPPGPPGTPRAGDTLRPGPDTPIWNELVRQLRPHLRRRGNQAALGRAIGLPRQRINDFVHRRATPDAERTLFLLCWLLARRRGRELFR